MVRGSARVSALSFTFSYATGQAWIQVEVTQLQSDVMALGIKLNLKPCAVQPGGRGLLGNCVVAKLPWNWDMADGAGLVRTPPG